MLHPADLWALEFPTSVPVLLSGRACIIVSSLDCGRRATGSPSCTPFSWKFSCRPWVAPHRLRLMSPWEPLKGSGDSPVTKSGQDPGFRKTLKSAIWAEETLVLPVRATTDSSSLPRSHTNCSAFSNPQKGEALNSKWPPEPTQALVLGLCSCWDEGPSGLLRMRLKGTEMVTVKYQLWVEGLTQQLALLPLPGFNFMSSGSTPPLPVTVLFAFPSSSWFLACPGRTLSRLGASH